MTRRADSGNHGRASSPVSMERVGKWAVPFLLALAPLLFYGVLHLEFVTSDIARWLPQGRSERQQYEEFLTLFGVDEFLVVSWSDCVLDDPRLERFADELRFRLKGDQFDLVQRVVSTAELVDELTSEPLELSHADALQRLQGVVVGPSGNGVILVQLTHAGTDHYARVLDLVTEVGWDVVGLDRESLRLGGSVFETVAIDEASHRSLTRYVIPSSLAALAVAWLCIGRLRLTLVALAIAGYCEVVGVALIYYLGGQLSSVLIVVPTLIFMLTLSASVHLINYYTDAGGDGVRDAGDKAIRIGWVPCMLASVTTAIGLGSLMASDLKPVHDFGFYASIALLVATVVLLLSFSVVVSLRPRDGGRRRRRKENTITVWGRPVTRLVLNYPGLVSSICVVGLLVVGWGITNLTSSAKVDRMFAEQSEIVRNYRWMEENIGPLISVEVIISFPQSNALNALERLELVSQVHDAVRLVPEVGGVVSPMTFVAQLPRGGGVRRTIRRTVFRNRLEQGKDQLSEKGVLATDEGGEHWRVTAKVPAIHDLDYGEMTENVRVACEGAIAGTTAADDVTITTTGLSPVLHEAQNLLLSDLAKSLLVAIALITPVMVVILRGVLAGLLAMIPNLAPIVLVFGVMGWLGVPLDIASVLTASVALGIAVDDTLHFITWFARASHRGESNRVAVAFAYRKCALAMIQTTLICSAAMLVFLPCDFLPTRKFAILMTLLLAGALVGDLILLPAILSGPLGRFVGYLPKRNRSISLGRISALLGSDGVGSVERLTPRSETISPGTREN